MATHKPPPDQGIERLGMATRLIGSVRSTKTSKAINHKVSWYPVDDGGQPIADITSSKLTSEFKGDLQPYVSGGMVIPGMQYSKGTVNLKRGTTVLKTGTYATPVSADGSFTNATVTWDQSEVSGAGVIFNGSANMVVELPA